GQHDSRGGDPVDACARGAYAAGSAGRADGDHLRRAAGGQPDTDCQGADGGRWDGGGHQGIEPRDEQGLERVAGGDETAAAGEVGGVGAVSAGTGSAFEMASSWAAPSK